MKKMSIKKMSIKLEDDFDYGDMKLKDVINK
jgi:hypothetical protein